MVRRFMAVFDLHYGYESKGGHKRAIHDPRAWAAVMKFAQDFKPHDFIFGGDILDCGAISHWNRHNPRRTEGMRLLQDAEGCVQHVIRPIEQVLAPGGQRDFIIGNHCDWLEDYMDAEPTLEGLLNVQTLLKLNKWKVIPQGGVTHLGRLWFAHGDQIKAGGEHVAKAAALHFNRSIRFGHFHTYQTFTATSAIDNEQPATGVCVPCLCVKNPAYNEGRPNRWAQGFCWGYVREDGSFNDYISVIIHGRFSALGKTYAG